MTMIVFFIIKSIILYYSDIFYFMPLYYFKIFQNEFNSAIQIMFVCLLLNKKKHNTCPKVSKNIDWQRDLHRFIDTQIKIWIAI